MAHDAKGKIRMPELDKGDKQAVLSLSTYKSTSGGGLTSYAQIYFLDGGFKSFELFGDFSKRIENNKGVRATQKNIDDQHARIFTEASIEQLKEDARHFYRLKNVVAA